MKRFSLLFCGLVAAALISLPSASRAADAGFSFDDKKGEHLDVLLDGKVVARYMYAHDKSTPERWKETYKPYLHVFDAQGKAPITQGAGGKQFPHHRGIYIGWQKLGFGGKTYNLWEMGPNNSIVHKAFAAQKAGPDEATFTSQTEWVLGDGRKVLDEERTFTVRKGPTPFRAGIDFTSKLTASGGDAVLGGDPEHGGVQFRPHGDVKANETVYVFPGESADPTKDKDYPWVGETFTLNDRRHSVVVMSHPDNPKETRWSAYRDYGRFGAFPTAPLKSGESLTLKFRFGVAGGEMPPADVIQKAWDQFAGVKEPSPAPKTTVKPVKKDAKPAAAPKAPAAKKDAATPAAAGNGAK